VRAAGTVLVVQRQIFQRGNLAAERGAHRIHDILTDESARVRDPIGITRRLGIEHDAHRLRGAGGEDDHLGFDGVLLSRGLIDIDDARGFAGSVHRDLAGHGIGDQIEITARERRRQMNGRRLVVRLDRAAAAAGSGPETRLPGLHCVSEQALGTRVVRMNLLRQHLVILLPTQHGAMNRNHGQPKFPGAGPGQLFTGAHGRRWLETALGRVRCVLEVVVVAVNADQHLNLVIVRSDVRVIQRPVEAEPVTAAGLEIVLAVAERNPSPVIRATAKHARAPPPEFPRGILRRTGVRLTGNLPATINRGVVKAERFVDRR